MIAREMQNWQWWKSASDSEKHKGEIFGEEERCDK